MILLCCAFVHVHTRICKKYWHCEETQDVNKASVVGIVYTVLLLQVCTHINIGSLFWLFNKLRGLGVVMCFAVYYQIVSHLVSLAWVTS